MLTLFVCIHSCRCPCPRSQHTAGCGGSIRRTHGDNVVAWIPPSNIERNVTQSTVCRKVKNLAIVQYKRTLTHGNTDAIKDAIFFHAWVNVNALVPVEKYGTSSHKTACRLPQSHIFLAWSHTKIISFSSNHMMHGALM